MGKSKGVGFAVLTICITAAISYTVTLFYPQWLVMAGILSDASSVQFWLIAVPVLLAFAFLLYVGVWFGCMKTTGLPPRLIERILRPIKRIRKILKPN